jgi:hypothetical protein
VNPKTVKRIKDITLTLHSFDDLGLVISYLSLRILKPGISSLKNISKLSIHLEWNLAINFIQAKLYQLLGCSGTDQNEHSRGDYQQTFHGGDPFNKLKKKVGRPN